MFIDFVVLLLINMTAGHIILALYFCKGMDEEGDKHKGWTSPFAMTGLVGLVAGLYMVFTWPLPGSFNAAYGEMTVLFSILFLGASLSIYKGWSLLPVTVYAFFAGIGAIVVGAGFIKLGLANNPLLAGTGFILSGLSGVCSLPAVHFRENKFIRYSGVTVLVIAGLIWAYTAYTGCWGHLSHFATWVPDTMK